MGLGFARGLRLRDAGSEAHPGVLTARAGVAGAHRNEAHGGAGVRVNWVSGLGSTTGGKEGCYDLLGLH